MVCDKNSKPRLKNLQLSEEVMRGLSQANVSFLCHPQLLQSLISSSHSVEDHTEGIPRFAALQNSNDSFSMFRRFGPDATRILINKEIELGQLTTKLHELDEADYADEANKRWRLSSAQHGEGFDPEQHLLVQKIEVKLGEYCEWNSY